MNSLEQKDVKNPGAICDGPSHNHSSARVPGCFEQKETKRTKGRLASSFPSLSSVDPRVRSTDGADFISCL